jgi:ATP-binding cassette subfamily B multidrug efflux pump
MPRSMLRMFSIATQFRGRLVFSQFLLAISALCTVGFATLTQGLVNEGMVAGDANAALTIGFWMFVLAVGAGVAMAGAAAYAVFFSQGTSYTIRDQLYAKLQSFSFGNYDRFPTGQLMVRLNADATNVERGMLYALLLGLYAPFIMLASLVLVILRPRS